MVATTKEIKSEEQQNRECDFFKLHELEDRTHLLEEAVDEIAHNWPGKGEASGMTEAPASANLKFVLGGYECQFTMRGSDANEIFQRLQLVVGTLEKIGAVAAFAVKPKGNGNGNGHKAQPEQPSMLGEQPAGEAFYSVPPMICPACGSIGEIVSGVKDGKPWTSQKCLECNTFIKGSFRPCRPAPEMVAA